MTGRGGFQPGASARWVLRLLRGEDLESVSRELGITAARASHWRDQFLAAGQAGLKSRAPDARDEEHEAGAAALVPANKKRIRDIPGYAGIGGIHLTGVTQIHSSPRAICGWALQARRVSAGRRRRRREGPRVRVGDQVLVPDRRMGRGQLQHPKEHEPAAAGAAAVEAKHKLVQVSGSVRVAH